MSCSCFYALSWPSLAYYRLAWCAIQWRVCLGQGRGARRGLASGGPFVYPLKRGDECHQHCDYHRDRKEYESRTVAITLVAHEITSPIRLFVAARQPRTSTCVL